MSYLGLGSRVVTAAPDQSGLNPGNLTSAFPVSVLTAKVAYYEVYSINVRGVPTLSTVMVFVGARLRTTALLAGNSEYEAINPVYMAVQDELYVCWDIPATTPGVKIETTVWMRYDPSIQPQEVTSNGRT